MRLHHTLRWRIALAYTALIFLSLGVVSLYLIGFVRQTYLGNLEERLQQEAVLISSNTNPYLTPPRNEAQIQQAIERLGQQIRARVTIIDRDGTVLADNWEDPSAMENHANRPEFADALQTGLGRSTRESAAINAELLYTAVPLRVDGEVAGVARIAVTTSSIQSNVIRIITTVTLSGLAVAILSVGLAYYLAHRTSRSVRSVTEGARRIARGDLDHTVHAIAQDETQELASAFNSMASSLRVLIRDLSEERNKLSAVLDTMADGVMVIGPERTIDLMNRAAASLLDASDSYAIGNQFMVAIRDYELQQLIEACRESGEPRHGEVELLHRRRFLSAIATPLSSHGQRSVLLTLHDLTGLRQVETTRREFVSNVSHELRSPLASVRAMVETLQDGAVADEEAARDFLDRVHRDVEHMSSMVNDLLELSRLESGQSELQMAPLDTDELIADTEALFRPAAEARHITLEKGPGLGSQDIQGDAGKLRQVLTNLLDNALKFAPDGGRIAITSSRRDGDVALHVTDTGPGIPQEHLAHIFERFYKVDRSRRDGGTGLGLAIVKHIVQAHGGVVSVTSKEGEGSTFTLTLPRSR